MLNLYASYDRRHTQNNTHTHNTLKHPSKEHHAAPPLLPTLRRHIAKAVTAIDPCDGKYTDSCLAGSSLKSS